MISCWSCCPVSKDFKNLQNEIDRQNETAKHQRILEWLKGLHKWKMQRVSPERTWISGNHPVHPLYSRKVAKSRQKVSYDAFKKSFWDERLGSHMDFNELHESVK